MAEIPIMVYFTLKIVRAVTDMGLNAPWFAGTVALAGRIGHWWWLPQSILSVFGMKWSVQGAWMSAQGPGHPPALSAPQGCFPTG